MATLFVSQLIDLKRRIPWIRTKREKDALRGLVEQRRRLVSEEYIQEQSAHIISQIEKMHWFREAKTVMVYCPVHKEVDLMPLVEKYKDQKTFLFPVTHRHSIDVHPYAGAENMKIGRYGVPEPQTAPWEGKIDLILVPGVVFDHKCNRIGRGGGYYDDFLKDHRRARTIGVCYDFQLKKHTIPHNWFDRPVNRVVCPTMTVGE